MSMERERQCTNCETTKTFYLAASTRLHLGEKAKWHCPDCDYGFVTIDDVVDSSASA